MREEKVRCVVLFPMLCVLRIAFSCTLVCMRVCVSLPPSSYGNVSIKRRISPNTFVFFSL